MTELPNGQVCSAIVLAAGEGARLRSWLEQQLGETLQKQYAKLLGPRSMLECTLDRVEKLIPRERIFTVVGRRHLGYPVVRAQLTSRAERTVISQPMNRDTGVGILLPLMHIVKRYPESLIAIFPSDHFIVEEDRFLAHVALAFLAVQRDPCGGRGDRGALQETAAVQFFERIAGSSPACPAGGPFRSARARVFLERLGNAPQCSESPLKDGSGAAASWVGTGSDAAHGSAANSFLADGKKFAAPPNHLLPGSRIKRLRGESLAT
ncbi:MAG: hypothetical protein A3G40_08270 [Deltaproteobacteria bacterium RIFCSPLOWO2_12_FULL_57_22]|nr:MAG: hypothetical protein A3G40_08270 [Deltaproteobacteria bacterium RIFCSPLOWO2_12_FULL_57_22]